MSTVTQRRYTYDDLRAMPDDGKRYELIDGELLVSPAPSYVHQQLVFRLARLIDDVVAAGRLGRVFLAPADVYFSEDSIVQPDLFFVSNVRRHLLHDGQRFEGAPDLIVEVLSPSTREVDLGRKLRRYEAEGVPEYWPVDPEARTVAVYALIDGKYQLVPPEGGRVRSLVLPDLEIDVAALFEDLW